MKIKTEVSTEVQATNFLIEDQHSLADGNFVFEIYMEGGSLANQRTAE